MQLPKPPLILAAFLAAFFLQAAIAQPLSLHPTNPHIFRFQGKALLLVGSGEHYGAVMHTGFDYEKYLETLKAEGLNLTRLFTGAHREPQGAFGIERNTMAPTDNQFLCAWEKTADGRYDLTRFDERYFRRLRTFMEAASRAGVIVEINLFSSIYGEDIWSLSPLHPKNNINNMPSMDFRMVYTEANGAYGPILEAYVRKMVETLNGFDNLYYEIQNEPWADHGVFAGTWNEFIQPDMLKAEGQMWRTRVDAADEKSLRWQSAITSLIRNTESRLPKKHLVSQDYTNFAYPLASPDPQIDIYTFHYGHPKLIAQNHHWNKPIGINETGFSGMNAEPYRRQAWRFLCSGGSLFNNLDYSFTPGREDGTDSTNNAPGHGSPAFRRSLRILRNLLETGDPDRKPGPRPWDLAAMQPDKQTVQAAFGADTYVVSDGSRQWVMFVEGYQQMRLRLQLPPGSYTIRWIDVLDGHTIDQQQMKATKDGVLLQIPRGYTEIAVQLTRD